MSQSMEQQQQQYRRNDVIKTNVRTKTTEIVKAGDGKILNDRFFLNLFSFHLPSSIFYL